MTLIAAFRCEAVGHPGVVICADSQETVGDYRVEVKKIKPRDAGQYDLIIGGSGNVAALIDGLANAVESNVKRWPVGLDEENARRRVERTLLSYHARQVAFYPAEQDEKRLCFIICVKGKSSPEIFLWKTDGTTIEAVTDWVLLGWEEAAYHYEVKWLYDSGMLAAQAVLLGVHLFTVAQNSLYIGGPTQVIVVRDNGMHVQEPQIIQNYKKRVGDFNDIVGSLVLACPDMSMPQESFRRLLQSFEDTVMAIRDIYLREAAAASVTRALNDPNWTGDALPAIPLGTLIHVSPEGETHIVDESQIVDSQEPEGQA